MQKQRQPRWGHNQAPSIDGFVRSGRNLGVPVSRSYQPNREKPTPTLGNFNSKVDGFYPTQQTARGADRAETQEAQLLDEPIVLDHIEEKKRRKLKFWQRHLKLKKFIKRTALTAMMLVLAGGAYFGYKLYHTQKKVLAGGGKAATVCTDDVDISQLNKEGDSRINILLLGIGGPEHDGSDLTDTIMLASVDPEKNTASLMSIPRDFWVRIPGVGSKKINEAYYWGKTNSQAKTDIGKEEDGIKLLDRTLQPVLDGVNIHYHILLDFKAFQQMVDAVGGVDANVPADLTAYENFWVEGTRQHYLLNVKAGPQHFDGMKALYYARERHNDSDFVRSQRQKLMIAAIKQKVFSAGTFSNPFKISSLLDSLGQNVYTDFSSNDIKCLYQQLSTIPTEAIKPLDLVTPPNNLLTTGSIGTQSVVEPVAGLSDYSEIHKFLHSSLKDGLILKENAHIAIYNATDTSGVATAQAGKLKEYGYNVTKTDSPASSTNPATTTIVDLTKGKDKYTRNYLQKRYGVTVSEKLPSDLGITPTPDTNFVIILGEDVAASSQN